MGLNPDFYMKTFHHDKCSSATRQEYRKDSGGDIRFTEPGIGVHEKLEAVTA